ncbi:MAG: hypothetical protein Kow0069_26330 [Promethearchaeota archaeon]
MTAKCAPEGGDDDAHLDEYYLNSWGFRPSRLRRRLDDPVWDWRLEDAFAVRRADNAPLASLSAQVAARVDVANGRERVRCQLALGVPSLGLEEVVECVHAVVYLAPSLADLSGEKLRKLARSTTGRLVNLSVEEHFAALRSFAAGLVELPWTCDALAEAGVGPLLVERLLAAVRRLLERAARAPGTRPRALSLLATFDDWRVRRAVAHHVNCDASTLAELANDPFPAVRAEVAENPNLTDETLRKLAADPFPNVRVAVANSPRCGPDLLKELALDRLPRVRAAVAGREDCPGETLRHLARERCDETLLAVAKNPATPPPALWDAWDGAASTRVLRAALAHRSCPAALRATDEARYLADNPFKADLRVAGDPETPVVLLERLVLHEDWRVRAAAAKNPRTPRDCLVALGGDESRRVRSLAAAALTTT